MKKLLIASIVVASAITTNSLMANESASPETHQTTTETVSSSAVETAPVAHEAIPATHETATNAHNAHAEKKSDKIGDPKLLKENLATCSNCHGQDGNSLADIFPNLAGQSQIYLAKQMTDFKTEKRKNIIMSRIMQVTTINEQAIHDLSTYFSKQTLKANAAKTSDEITKGKLVFEGGVKENNVPSCMGCHGPKGAGNPGAGFPSLRSQKAAYIEKQLKNFKLAGQNPDQETKPLGRHNDPNSVMRTVVRSMNDFDIKAVAQYVQQIQP